DADTQARAREGLAVDDLLRQTQLAAHGADLILEQQAQRLDELELDVIRQATDIVVALDVRGTGTATRLDDVRVEGALHQVVDLLALEDTGDGTLEGTDELGADGLALGLRLADAGELVQEGLALVDGDQAGTGGGDDVEIGRASR